MGILNNDQSAGGQVDVIHPDGGFHLGRIEDSSISGKGHKLNSRKGGARPSLIIHGVRSGFDDDFVPRLGVGFDGQLIGHRP